MELDDASCRILAGLLEARTGQQLSIGRKWRIGSSLSPLMRARGIGSVDQLIATLVAGREPGLADEVVETMLNNETSFFRDRAPFELLFGGAIERLRHARGSERRLAIWSAGCSTGQEAYSLAMRFADEGARWRNWDIEIVGTDVSGSAVARARQGAYSQFEVQRGLPVVQMMRWFEQEGPDRWQIAPTLRDAVRFEVRSIVEPPPRPGSFDILLCRNVLLYLGPEVRRTAFQRLREASKPDSILMLGAGETVIGQTDAFAPDREHRGLYLRTGPDQPVERRAAGTDRA